MFKIRNKRETGFEILRILAMFFIIVVHLLNAGGILKNANENTISWHKMLYSFFTPSVNVFVLVSAYFMATSKIKFKKLLSLWFQVVFYTLTTYLFSSLLIYKNFSFSVFVGCFFPIISKKYWFFSAYFILMLISPFLNKILNNSTKKELYLLSGLLFIISYLSLKQSIGSIYDLNSGYSVLWFITLYIFAGTLKLYPLNIKKTYTLIIYCILLILMWIFDEFNYNDPLVVLASISLLLLFDGIKIKNIYIHNSLCYVSSLTFGIYLIESSFLKNYWRFNVFKIQNFYTSTISPLWVVIIAFNIFVLCSFIEIIRKFLIIVFKKIKYKIIENRKKIND